MTKYQKWKATKSPGLFYVADVKYHISEEACVATLAGCVLDLFAIIELFQ